MKGEVYDGRRRQSAALAGDAYWIALKADMLAAVYSKTANYMLPYAPSTNFYGGLMPHFNEMPDELLTEETYYAEGDGLEIAAGVIIGLVVTVDGAVLSGGTSHVAANVKTNRPGRRKFIFPGLTGANLAVIAASLPNA